MKFFTFYQDVKVTSYLRDVFDIEAETKEEAIEIIKANREEIIKQKDLACVAEWLDRDNQVLLECAKEIEKEDNNNLPTFEIIDKDGEIVLTN